MAAAEARGFPHQVVNVVCFACGCIWQSANPSSEEQVQPSWHSVACVASNVGGNLQNTSHKRLSF